MLRLAIAGTIALLCITQISSGVTLTVAGRTWEEFNGHWYSLTDEHGTWAENETAAIQAGGHLVTINDDAENTFVLNFADGLTSRNFGGANQRIAWIGLRNAIGWASGEPVTYYRGIGTSPGGGPHWFINTASYVSAGSTPHPGDWGNHNIHNDLFDYQLRGVIERNTIPTAIPEPLTATLSLIAVGVVGICAVGARRNTPIDL